MMADSAQREPTMEEILASIRKIISEDEAAGGDDALDLASIEQPEADALMEPAQSAVEAVEPVAEIEETPPEPAPPEPEPVVEAATPEPAPEPEPEPAQAEPDVMFVEREAPVAAARQSVAPGEGIVADGAAQQAAGALGKLMGSMMVSSGNTLDDVVRELLRPMLKEWLDANLPALVEAEVSRELDRIRRMAR